MKKCFTVHLSSVGMRILSSIMSVLLITLSIVLTVAAEQAPWYAIATSIIISLFCIFTCFFSFHNKITVDAEQQILTVSLINSKKFKLGDIENICVDTANSVDKRKYCWVIINLTNGEIHRLPGYSTLIRRKAVQHTRTQIEILNTYLDEIVKSNKT